MSKQNKIYQLISLLAFVLVITAMVPSLKVNAQESTTSKAVSISNIDYDALTMQVNFNGNVILYYSTDKVVWYEVEGNKTSDNKAIVMDISWIPSTADKTLYFKGDNVTTVISITLPAKDSTFKATYNKADCDFVFDNCDEATSFEWKKVNDYNWKVVSLDASSTSYKNFLKEIERLLLRGGKINLRLPQVTGKSESVPGVRPSKEVTVTLTKRANAPAIKVDAAKLYLNTSTAMEYYSETSKSWIDCDKNMLIEDIAPSVLLKNGSKAVTVMIRTAATEKSSYSKTAYVTIPGQKAAPTIGGSGTDLSYWYQNGKLVLQFNKASVTSSYGFAIIKPGQDFDVNETKFVSVTSAKGKTIAVSAAPEGSVIYIRKMGSNENTSKNIRLELASEITTFTVTYK
jgi:hypothetical protein